MVLQTSFMMRLPEVNNQLNYNAANSSNATIFVILIIGLTAGPAVSL